MKDLSNVTWEDVKEIKWEGFVLSNDKEDITLREHLARIGKSKSERKLAALAENRKKKVPVMTPGAIYQRKRRAMKHNTKPVREG